MGGSGQKIQFLGAVYRLGAAIDLQLAENLVEIPFDGTHSEEKLIGDFAVREAIGNQSQDFKFALGEGFVNGWFRR